ncbi:MAG: ribbon-helix-helix protein, CopG family, partial [Microcoleus sp. T3-bin5]|nr:ribbon-helix-helix protein, CopG family [Microcoleus sp. T3-bin5]
MVKKNRNVVSSNSESKVKVGLSLTSYSAARLNAIARKLGISRSELLERLAKGALDISRDKTEVTVTWKKGEETEVEAADLQGETAEESEINDARTAETLLDSVKVKPNPLQESYEALQQQLAERESSIESLQQQVAEKEQREHDFVQQLAEKSSSIESLQQQVAAKDQREHDFVQQ